jgi:hypothetical protein
MVRRRWRDLDGRTRRLILVGAVLEGSLKAAALVDLARRPATKVRGRKALWATAIVLVNSVGGAPIAYFALGRRR